MRALSSLTVLAVLAALALAAPASGAPAGSLDAGFNGTGVRTDQLDLGTPPAFSFYDDVVTGADGRIQAVGATQDADGLSKITVRGLTLAGAPDATWAGGATRFPVFTATAPDVAYHQANAALRAPDGKLLVAGTGGVEHIPQMLDRGFVQRYRADGTLDPDFGTGGSVQFVVPSPAGPREAGFGGIAVDAAGRVLAVGQDRPASGGGGQGLLVRFLANGQLDTSLGGTGWILFPAVESWSDIVLDTAGGAWLRGSDAAGGVIARVGADFAPVTSFGTNGLVHVPQISTSTATKKTLATGFAVLPDQRIVVVGWTSWRQGVGFDFDVFESWMMRFTAAGALDPAFDGDGIARWHFGEDGAGTWADSGLADVVVQENGAAVAVGQAGTSDGDKVHDGGLVIRVLPDGSLDPRFGTAGQVRLKLGAAGGNTILGTMALGPARRILLAGGIADSATTLAAGVVRLIGDGDPTAALSAPAQVKAGTKATLDSSASADDWKLAETSWDLNGDGVFGDATGQVVTPVLSLGPHTVTVRVTDDAAQTSQASAQVKVVVPFTVKLPKQLKLSGSSVKVPVTCAGPDPCRGTLSLLLKAKTKAARIVTVNVGRASFALRAGQRRLVRVKLARRVRTAVRRRGKVTLAMAVRTKGVAETLQRSQVVVRR